VIDYNLVDIYLYIYFFETKLKTDRKKQTNHLKIINRMFLNFFFEKKNKQKREKASKYL